MFQLQDVIMRWKGVGMVWSPSQNAVRLSTRWFWSQNSY